MQTTHPALAPQRIGAIDLKNRLAVAPMTRVSAAPDGTPTDEMVSYYAEFARGGFGVVITEGTYTDVAHSQSYLNQPGLAVDAHVEGWRRVVDAVHAEGVPLIAQLMHAGALSQGNSYGIGTIAPSPIAPRGEMLEEYGGSGSWPTPREMCRRRHRLGGPRIRRRCGPRASRRIRWGRAPCREWLSARPVSHRVHEHP